MLRLQILGSERLPEEPADWQPYPCSLPFECHCKLLLTLLKCVFPTAPQKSLALLSLFLGIISKILKCL